MLLLVSLLLWSIMHSVLDATVIIQILNFVCAYWILSRIFLKPAYVVIMKIDQERAALKREAQTVYDMLAFEKEKKMYELTVRQQELVRAAPVIKKAVTALHQAKVIHDNDHLTEKDKKKLLTELTASLKKRIIHE